MKKREKNHKKEPILQKEVNTPNGMYNIKLILSADPMFSKSFDFHIQHIQSGVLEKLLGQDTKIWKDACHDYGAEDQKHGKVLFENTTPHEVGYNHTNGRFFVSFFQDIRCLGDGTIIDKYKRSKLFPVPETIYRKIRKYFKN